MRRVLTDLTKEELQDIFRETFNELQQQLIHPPSQEEDLMSTTDVCEMLKISRTTLHNYVKQGKIECFKLGARSFFSRSQIMIAVMGKEGGHHV